MNYLFWLKITDRILPWWKEWKYRCVEYGTFLHKIQNHNRILVQRGQKSEEQNLEEQRSGEQYQEEQNPCAKNLQGMQVLLALGTKVLVKKSRKQKSY